MKIALVGQPNCGKSTIFNSVAGYRAATGNFPGTTVRLAWSTIRFDCLVAELVDVPGIYSLTSANPAESAAKNFLFNQDISLIINVLDASLLSRSLALTLELRELGIPIIVCLRNAVVTDCSLLWIPRARQSRCEWHSGPGQQRMEGSVYA